MTRSNFRLALNLVLVVLLAGGTWTARAQEPDTGEGVTTQDTYTGNQGGAVDSIGSNLIGSIYQQAADDVSVPGGNTIWLVTNINVEGNLTSGAPDSVRVFFYTNASNLPSAQAYGATLTSGIATGNFSLTLPNVAVLFPGLTYWLSVQAQTSSLSRLWNWSTRGTQVGNPAAYLVSTSGDPCQNAWKVRITICQPGIPGPDHVFTLTYTPFVVTDRLYLSIVSKLP